MLFIDPKALDGACEALMIAALSCKDQGGLRVAADTPKDGLAIDVQRIRAITLGAIVALVNGAAVPGDETHLTGFGAAGAPR